MSCTISKMSGNRGSYYIEIASEKYYSEGGEPLGHWLDSPAAKELGISGKRVQVVEFKNLLLGFSPDGKTALTQSSGKSNRQLGWDVTCSGPKPVGIVWALGHEEATPSQSKRGMARVIRAINPEAFGVNLRRAIEANEERAVGKVVQFLNENAIRSRRGKGGQEWEKVSLIAATFFHGTSRKMDPQPHTHIIVLNLCRRSDGTWGTIDPRGMFELQKEAGRAYRKELALGLEKLGFEMLWRGDSFEISGLPKALSVAWSKRRNDIEKALAEKGLTSWKAAKVAALDTRPAKTLLPRAELVKRWSIEARDFGVTRDSIEELRLKHFEKKLPDSDSQKPTKRVEEIHVATKQTKGLSEVEKGKRQTIGQLPTVKRIVPKEEKREHKALPKAQDNLAKSAQMERKKTIVTTDWSKSTRSKSPGKVPPISESPSKPLDPMSTDINVWPSEKSKRTSHEPIPLVDRIVGKGEKRERESKPQRPPSEHPQKKGDRTSPSAEKPRETPKPIREPKRRRIRTTKGATGELPIAPDNGKKVCQLWLTKFELRVVRDSLFPKAPAWSPVKNFKIPKLVIARDGDRMDVKPKRYSVAKWKKEIGPLVISSHKKTVFPWAPEWSPVRNIETTVLAINKKAAKAREMSGEPSGAKVQPIDRRTEDKRERAKQHGGMDL